MKELISSAMPEGAKVAVHYGATEMLVGVGLEMETAIPNAHFIDAMYGDVPTQTEIGRLFYNRALATDFEIQMPEFKDSDSRAEWHNALGRIILDSVTASSETDSLWTWLDRPSVNRLIRLLRKARDSAFGRDE